MRKVSEILKIAKTQYDERRFDISALIAKRAMDLEPDSPEANHYVGVGDLLRDQPVNAEKHLRVAHASQPSDSKVAVALARALHQQDRTKEAFDLLQAFLEKAPNSVEVAELLVLWHTGADERRAKVEELAARFPKAWLPVKLRGDLAFSAGQIEDALELHRQSWEMHPSDDAATMILHELDSLGRGEEAVTFALGLEDLNSRAAPLRWNAANVCIKSGRLKPAVALLDAMISDTKLPTDTRFNATLLLSEVLASSRVR